QCSVAGPGDRAIPGEDEALCGPRRERPEAASAELTAGRRLCGRRHGTMGRMAAGPKIARDRWRKWAIVGGGAVGRAGGGNNVGDQVCPPGSDPNDKGDECPYGPPGGPRVSEKGCPDIAVDPTGAACGTLSWNDDIFPLLTSQQTDQSRNCSSSVCHDR